MPSTIEQSLADLGVVLPEIAAAPKAAGNYLPFVTVGDMVYVSGQISQDASGLIKGRVGQDMTLDQGAAAARACAIALITQLKVATQGDLDRLIRVVKLTGFVNSTPDFTDQPKVINGASDFMVAVFGERGRHARAAVGVASLPLGVAVEIEAIFQIR
jgi:enamine deaminase RidA (YjgF/YER057c/UK114 family)